MNFTYTYKQNYYYITMSKVEYQKAFIIFAKKEKKI